MTRSFNTRVTCSACGATTTAETGFSRWLRNNGSLSSGLGHVCADVDLDWWRVLESHGRKIMCGMHVEVKTFGADLTEAQRDLLYLKDQVFRNRRNSQKAQVGGAPVRMFSTYNKKRIPVRMYGSHLLRFQATSPDDSDWIMWDKREISAEMLQSLLQFRLCPDNLTPMDARSHHAADTLTHELPLIVDIETRR